VLTRSSNRYGHNCHSNWYRWGRWVLAGILIFIAAIALLFFVYVYRPSHLLFLHLLINSPDAAHLAVVVVPAETKLRLPWSINLLLADMRMVITTTKVIMRRQVLLRRVMGDI
jgi:hypothetical protein